jgi:hypothetical protein
MAYSQSAACSSSSLSSLPARGAASRAIILSFLILFIAALTPAWGQQTKAVDHQGGPGGSHLPATKVEFKPGPFGPDGKVIFAVPDASARRFPNEIETPQEREGEMRAEAGLSNPSGKPVVKVMSSKQLSLLNWNPERLDPVQNPVLGGDFFKAEKKNPLQVPKGFKYKPGEPVKGPDFAGSGDTGYFPPDGGIAAGPYQVVETVNSTVNVYDKNGNLLSSQTLNNFFSPLGAPGTDFLYDPSMYYDQLTGRFWMLAVSENDSASRSNLLVAVSFSSDVTQGWYIFALDATYDGGGKSSNWCDYPHMGMDADAIYMSCNQFSFPSSSSSFQYAKVRIVSKDEFINLACCSWYDFWNLKEGFLNFYTSFAVRPALERWVGYNFGDFWVDAEGSGGSGSTIKVWQLTDPEDCCNGGNPTLNGNEQSVGSYDSPPAGAQPNGVTGLDTGGTRILYATYQFGHLSFGQTTSCSVGGATHSCAGFTEVDVSGYPSMSNVNDWVWAETGEDIYYPFVDQNVNSDKTMVYTRSDGSSTYPGAYYAGIPSSATCTLCIDGEVAMAYGQSNYSVIDGSGRNRWGDYQGASNDPDFLGIWVEGEYVSSSNSWAKEINSSYNSYFPIDSASPTSLAFGNEAIFGTAATQYVTFTNTGNATMYTSSTEISGDSSFFISYDGCRGLTLYPGASCFEGVSFDPSSLGSKSGFVIVFDNTSATEGYSSLSGTGVQAGTSTSLVSSLNPSVFGQNVTFTAHVSSLTSGTPTGAMKFYNGNNVVATVNLSSGSAQYSTASLGGGAHTISAVYQGSTLYVTSSAALTQQVNGVPTTTKVVSSLNPSTYGNSVTFTATVTANSGTPTGSVTFKDGGSPIGTTALSGSKATFATAKLAGGTHTITAVYDGAADFAGSTSGNLSQVVHKAVTTSKVTSAINPQQFHQNVTFTATVTSTAGTPTGTVTFHDAAGGFGTVALNGSGVAQRFINNLPVGNQPITVIYNGDTNFATDTSPKLTEVVNKASTTVALASSKNPQTHGKPVTFIATITPAFGGNTTGSVTFKDGSTTLGTGTVTGNVAKFTTSSLTTGTHNITAVYPGDTDFKNSASAVLKQVIN